MKLNTILNNIKICSKLHMQIVESARSSERDILSLANSFVRVDSFSTNIGKGEIFLDYHGDINEVELYNLLKPLISIAVKLVIHRNPINQYE